MKEINDKILEKLYSSIAEEIIGEDLASLPDESDIEHTFSSEFEAKINILLLPKNEKTKYMISNKTYKRLAIILLVIIGCFATLTFTVEAFRNRVFNLFTDTKSTHTKFGLNELNDIDLSVLFYSNLSIPLDFELVDSVGDNSSYMFIFENADDMRIIFTQEIYDSNVLLDTENAAVDIVTINNNDVYIVLKGEMVSYVWYDHNMIFSILSDLGQDDIINILKEIL